MIGKKSKRLTAEDAKFRKGIQIHFYLKTKVVLWSRERLGFFEMVDEAFDAAAKMEGMKVDEEP